MEKLSLNTEIRSSLEKLKDLRISKKLPAVVYWHKQEPISLKLEYSEFLKTFRKSGESHIIELNVNWNNLEVLVHSVQKDPISWDFLHVDFYAITKWEKVHTKIHLEFTWSSDAVKEWALLEEHLKELEIKCLPKDLVDSFQVNVSSLKEMGDSIRVSDLDIDFSKYDVITNSNDIVVVASKPAKVEIKEETVTETKEEVK